MRFSIWPTALQSVTDVLETAAHAEATGWDGVWFADHFMADAGSSRPPQSPMLEAGSMVAALAVTVPRVRLGTLVYGNTYRHPAVLANMAATVDHLSGGRFTLGIGAGWQVNEHQQYGIELPPVGKRIDRFAEAVQVVRSLLSAPRTSFAGEYYRLDDALCEPKPLQQPLPLMIGASGEKRMLGLVAQHADLWNCWGLPDLVAHKSRVLDDHCARVGRAPHEISRTAQALVFVTPDVATADRITSGISQAAYGGPPQRLVEIVAAYAEAGLDELIVPDSTLGTGIDKLRTMDTLMTQVAAQFR